MSTDSIVGRAVEGAGHGLVIGERPAIQERYLELALIASFPEAAPGYEPRPRERLSIPDWDPEPGAVDLTVRSGGEQSETIAVELKLDDIDQTMWDLFKLASLLDRGHVGSAYLIVGAPTHTWARGRDCSDLFRGQPVSAVWDTKTMFRDWPDAWTSLLRGGSGRPRSLPTRIETRFVTACPIDAYPDYELRCIGIRMPEEGARVGLVDGWPAE